MFFHTMEVSEDWQVTSILQSNIIFVQQNKEIHTGSEQLESE